MLRLLSIKNRFGCKLDSDGTLSEGRFDEMDTKHFPAKNMEKTLKKRGKKRLLIHRTFR